MLKMSRFYIIKDFIFVIIKDLAIIEISKTDEVIKTIRLVENIDKI